MKKHMKILIILILVIGLLSVSIKSYAITATVNANEVGFRRKPSTEAEIMDLLDKGTEVEILEENGEWYKVRYIDEENLRYTGYIKQEKLDVSGNTENSQNTAALNTAASNTNVTNTTTSNTVTSNTTVTNTTDSSSSETKVSAQIQENATIKLSSKLDLRILPLINSSKIGSVNAGTEVFISEIICGWCKIEANNVSGWILASLL